MPDRATQTMAGIVEADAAAVWDALLETTSSLTSITGVRAEAGPARRTLAVSGQWW